MFKLDLTKTHKHLAIFHPSLVFIFRQYKHKHNIEIKGITNVLSEKILTGLDMSFIQFLGYNKLTVGKMKFSILMSSVYELLH
jgi:hypothetical protein